jgi:hypothetical protein
VSAGELVLVVAAVLCSIGFAALIVVLLRVLDTLRDVRREVDQLRMETTPLIRELLVTTDEARATVDEARADLERFDRVLGSAEAIGDAVGGRVARTTFSSPMIKAAGLARGTSRTISRLRGTPRRTSIGTVEVRAIEGAERFDVESTNPSRWRKRA